MSRSFAISASVRSLTFVDGLIPAASHASSARLRPMPWMCVSAIEMCLLTGILIPAMRAIVRPSTLSLLVARIRADHPDDALAPDDLAVAADPAHRSSYFHLCHSR